MPLANSALSLVLAHRSAPDALTAGVLSRVLNTLVRHAPGPVYVSKAAQAEADRWKLGDLREYHWDDQVKKMRDAGRKTFAWDHFYPVAELRRQLNDMASPTEEQVRSVLRLASVAWILKLEDRELNKLKYRSRRPDPRMAYAEAGIELLHCS